MKKAIKKASAQLPGLLSGKCPICKDREADLMLHIKQEHSYKTMSPDQKKKIYRLIQEALESYEASS